MTEEEKIDEQNLEAAVSEQPQDAVQDDAEQKMVPLSAMLATREKLREAENRAMKAEAAAQAYAETLKLNGSKDEAEPDADPNSLVERKELLQNTQTTKREILETLYQDMNPDAVQKINLYLKSILEKKPWLAQSVDTAQNRYARAYEIVQDYMHLVEPKAAVAKKSAVSDGQRIVQNSQKPGSPTNIGKSARPEGMEYLKSIQGKAEFREYRQKVLQGKA